MTESHRNSKAMDSPLLVAHRGYAARYPENSLPGCEAALNQGCRHIEIDIQLTADGVPVLLHDQSLARTAGQDIFINMIHSNALADYDIAEHQRLGNDIPFTAIATLATYVELMQRWPTATSFVEIKEESLASFGHEFVTQQVLAVLQPIIDRCIVISYDIATLRHIRALGACRTGWILKRYDDQQRQLASQLRPDYLICNYLKVADDELWPGNWQWMLYEITTAALALALFRRGATLIETMAIGELLQDLQQTSRHDN